METIALYLIKSSGLIALFYFAYYWLLRKETFFTSNRYFLLGGLLISVVLPLFYYTKIIEVIAHPIDLSQYSTSKNNVILEESTYPFKWITSLILAYALGITLLIARFAMDYFNLKKVLKGKQVSQSDNYKFLDINENIAPFSYFKTIVYNSNLYSQSELENILEHEKIHSEQLHTLDVLIARFFCVAFWFNPIVWLYQKAILQNLEFIADHEATQKIGHKKQYQITLLKITTHQNSVAISNHFYQSLIKKRIVMLNKNQSNKKNYVKYALVVPALIAFVYLFQANVIAQQKKNQVVEQKIATENVVLIINKNNTDSELKQKTIRFKEEHSIDLKISKIKRNSKNEITGIKIEFDDNKGQKGTNQVQSDQPIELITIVKTMDQKGNSRMGFYTNNARKVVTIENGSNTMVEVENNSDYTISDFEEIPIPESAPSPMIAEVALAPLSPTIPKQKIIIHDKSLKNNDKPIVYVNGKKVETNSDELLETMDPNTIETVNVIKKNNQKTIMITTKGRVKNTSLNNTEFIYEIEGTEQVKKELELSKKELEQSKKELESSRKELEKTKLELEKTKKGNK